MDITIRLSQRPEVQIDLPEMEELIHGMHAQLRL